MKLYRRILVLIFTSIATLMSAQNALDKGAATVLVVNSFIESTTFPTHIINALRKELNQFPPTTYRLSTEKFNPYLIRTTDESRQHAAAIIDKYRFTPPSLLIIIGTPAWVCLREELARRWKDIPVLLVSESDYVTTTEHYLRMCPLDDIEKIPLYQSVIGYNMTVVRKPVFVRETLDLMKRLKPEMKKLYLISDRRYGSIQMRAAIQKNIERYHPYMEISFLTEGETGLEEMCNAIQKTDNHSGVLYYSWTQDVPRKLGKSTIDIHKLLATVNKQPIFTLEDVGLDDGSLAGGYFGTNTMLCTTVMEMMREIIYKGRRASDIPWRMSNDIGYHLNLPVLQTAGIPKERIPHTAKLLYAPPSFVNAHLTEIIIILIGGAVILLCILNIRYLRKVNHKQKTEMIAFDRYKNAEYAQEIAAESDKLKSAFLANISHELRTPLNAIIGFSSMLMDTEKENEKREYMKLIEQNNAILLRTVDDLISLSQADSMVCECDSFDLYDLFIDMEHTVKLRLHAANKQKQVRIKLDKIASCTMVSDYKRLSDVIDQLLNNAVKFTTKGTIHFGFRREETQVYIYVKDTGRGISAKDLDSIFKSFNKTDAFSQGIGIGLTICKYIVDKLGGTMGVDSEEGVGSTFWVALPYSSAKS